MYIKHAEVFFCLGGEWKGGKGCITCTFFPFSLTIDTSYFRYICIPPATFFHGNFKHFGSGGGYFVVGVTVEAAYSFIENALQ